MNRLLTSLSVLVVTALASVPALADTYTYTYTGNDFTTLSDHSAYSDSFPNLYTTSDSVFGSFTVSTQLASDLNLATIAVDSAIFTDGVQTLSTQQAASAYIQVSTDSSGDITSWSVTLQRDESDIATADALEHDELLNLWYEAIGDTGVDLTGTGAAWRSYTASNSNDPGTWSMTVNPSIAATPEPSSLLLLGTSLLGTAGIFRRRFVR